MELKFTKILGEWLQKTGTWTACWRATRDGWAANSTFHTYCDGKIPTLTIVKIVKDSKNLIFGGYCTVTWGECKFDFLIIYIYYRCLLHVILQHCHMVLSTEVFII